MTSTFRLPSSTIDLSRSVVQFEKTFPGDPVVDILKSITIGWRNRSFVQFRNVLIHRMALSRRHTTGGPSIWGTTELTPSMLAPSRAEAVDVLTKLVTGIEAFVGR